MATVMAMRGYFGRTEPHRLPLLYWHLLPMPSGSHTMSHLDWENDPTGPSSKKQGFADDQNKFSIFYFSLNSFISLKTWSTMRLFWPCLFPSPGSRGNTPSNRAKASSQRLEVANALITFSEGRRGAGLLFTIFSQLLENTFGWFFLNTTRLGGFNMFQPLQQTCAISWITYPKLQGPEESTIIFMCTICKTDSWISVYLFQTPARTTPLKT